MPKNPTQLNILKTPKLRFPGFDGVWEEKKMGEIFSNKIKRNKDSLGIDVLTNSATQGIINQRDYFDKDIAVQGNLENYYVVDIDDFIYNPRISNSAPVGPLKRNKLKKGVMSPLYTVLKPKEGDYTFLEKYFETSRWYRYMYKIANYGARHDRMAILQDDFMKMPVPFPQLPEQQKIALFLGGVDAWIENLREQKKSLESYKKSLMQKIFSQQIRFKDEKGNDFPEWEEKRVGEIFLGEKGTGLSKEKITEDGERECILYGELYTTYKEVIFNIKSKTNSKEGILSKIGDLLVPCSTTTVGIDLANVTALNKEGILLGGDITILRGKKEIDNIFYAYYLSNYKKNEIARYAQGVTIIHLYYNHFKNMMIDVPSLPEQQKIAEFLSSVDQLLESKQQQISKAEEWKKGLMQGLFV